MRKEEFIEKTVLYKKQIADYEKEIGLLINKIDILRVKVKTEKNDREMLANYQFELKDIYLKTGYAYLLMNRFSEEYLETKSDNSIEKIRKNLILTVGIWEKDFGEGLNELTNRVYLENYTKILDNKARIHHFKLITFLSEKLISLISPSVKWYWAAIDIKTRSLIAFCNAIDFKLMLKEYNPERSNYIYYHQVYDLLLKNSEEVIDFLWQKHYSVEIKKRTMTDIQLGINLLDFFIHLEKVFNENKYREKYTKKKQSWEHYRENFNKKNEIYN